MVGRMFGHSASAAADAASVVLREIELTDDGQPQGCPDTMLSGRVAYPARVLIEDVVLHGPGRLASVGYLLESACVASDVCRARAAKSASAWRTGAFDRTATAAIRQSMSLRTVSPLRRHVR